MFLAITCELSIFLFTEECIFPKMREAGKTWQAVQLIFPNARQQFRNGLPGWEGEIEMVEIFCVEHTEDQMLLS